MGNVSSGRISDLTGKLFLSNLAGDVDESPLYDLFSQFGLRSVTLHYDRHGHSLGTAVLCFHRREEAIQAMKECGGMSLVGFPMTIEFLSSRWDWGLGRSGVVGTGRNIRLNRRQFEVEE